MKIDYDPAKNARNIAERDLSFERVHEFDFDKAVITQDRRRDYPETRYAALGKIGNRVYVVCFTLIAAGVRVISFRKANPREVKRYEKARPLD